MSSDRRENDDKIKTFDDVLDLVGATSPYNVIVILLCASVGFMTPMQIMSSGFLTATPNYWCQVEELVAANWTTEEIRTFSSPGNESCEYYNYDYSVAANLGYDAVMNDPSLVPMENGTTECTQRFFEEGVDSIVTEWDLVCDKATLASTTVAAAQAGMFIGSIGFGYILDGFGRKFGMVLSILGFIPSGLIIAASVNVYMFMVFRILVTAFGFGMYLSGFVLSMEICAPKHRSIVTAYFVIPWAIGYMLTAVIAYSFDSWRYMQVGLTLPATMLLLNLFIVPESPRWLCLQGFHKRGLEVLKNFAVKNNNKIPTDGEMINILERVNPMEQTSNDSFSLSKWIKRWVKPQIKWITPIIFFCWFSVAMVYYGVSLGAATFGLNEYVFIFVGGILEIVSYLLIYPGISLFGRKKCLVFTFIVAAASIFGVMAMQQNGLGGAFLSVLSYSGKFMVTAAFHLVYIITGELYSTNMRSLMIGEASVFARCGSILSPYVGILFGTNIEWAPAAFFGAFSLVAGLLSALLPETKGKSLDAVDEVKSNSNAGASNEGFEPEFSERM